MYGEADAERFAEFCFARIYHAMKYGQQGNMSVIDFLISSVFTEDVKLTNIPFRKDHYFRENENTMFPSATFQGMVDNVGFLCKTQEACAEPNAVAGERSGGEIKKEKERQEPIESIVLAPAPAPRPAQRESKTLYLMRDSTHIYGNHNNSRSKLVKYGVVHHSSPTLATKLGRYPLFFTHDDKIKLGAVEIQDEVIHTREGRVKQMTEYLRPKYLSS
jgi:hypothetical protein